MNKLKSLALAALTAFGLSAYGGTNAWWEVNFESPTANNVWLIDENTGLDAYTLTNNGAVGSTNPRPYTNGVWTCREGDESYITNEFYPHGNFGDTYCLKLDTQGNDFTWTPDNPAENIISLVDADLYLVGSDSPPDAADFDPTNSADRVQTAIFLRNFTDEDSGETTNSVLCVYVSDDDTGDSYWQPLEGRAMTPTNDIVDNNWYHIQVMVDHAGSQRVSVFVDGIQMHARGDATTVDWSIANKGAVVQNGKKISSVSFRGTGAVDNFVGSTLVEDTEDVVFKAEVYMDGVLQAEGLTGNTTRSKLGVAGRNQVVNFPQFLLSNYNYAGDDGVQPTWSLSRMEIVNFSAGVTNSYEYEWDEVAYAVVSTDGKDNDAFKPVMDSYEGVPFQTGPFDVEPSTYGAKRPADPTEPVTIAKIYFKTIGAYDAYATTTVGATTTTNAVTLKPVDLGGVYPTNVVWTFDAVKGDTILTNIVLSGGATFDGYANGAATVKATVADELAADTLYASAFYVAGALADGQDLRPTTNGDEIVFAPYTPPVAVIGTDEYPSLRAAILAATAGDTITLLRDDHVSFTVDDPILDIDFEVTIDGGSNTLYGLTDYNGASYHEIRISGTGNVAIKNLRLTEFSDSAPMTQQYMPICTRSTYTGTLTLDGVTVDKFNRVALLLCGGDFLITNCVITGSAEGTTYFQSAVETYHASGTVVDTTISGIGALNAGTEPESGDAWAAAVFTVNQGGTGTITVKSGTYTGQFVTSFNKNSTGAINLEDGVFIATVEATEEAFLDDSNGGSTNTISGGWFDREPAAGYIAEGYKVVEDVPGAPVDGAYQHVVPDVVTYDITFNDEDGTLIVTTNVVAGATEYAPADPTRAGFTFLGWTNVLDATTVYTGNPMPAATSNATYAAKYEASAVQPPEVDAGDGLAGYNAAHENDPGFTPVEPITFAVPEGGQDELCSLAFVATQPGWYYLYTSTTVTGPFEPDYTTKVQITDVGDLVRLTESAAGTSKFFKIGWSATDPTAE